MHRTSIAFLASTALAVIGLATLALGATGAWAEQPQGPRHAATTFGDPPKYAADFKHWDYVNPNAPVGGVLKLDAFGTFDSLNDMIVKGTPATGVSLIYDSLVEGSSDELTTYYCVVCETVEVDPDGRWSIFKMRPEARFHDGHPMTADDVVFTFETLMAKGAPRFRARFGDITRAEALDPHTVKFHISENNTVPEMPIIAGVFPILPKHYWQDREFDAANLDIPLGSGRYKIKSVNPGRSITFERVEDFWGRDLPHYQGVQNWGEISYEYFRDNTVATEAFKGGAFDFTPVSSSLEWERGFDLPAVKDGRLIKEAIPHSDPVGFSGFWMNTRRDVFKDRTVRRALSYLYDFETARRTIHANLYKRTTSYFQNTDWASRGVPEGDELALLEPFRDQLPPELFSEPFSLPVNDGNGLSRDNLRSALRLFREAGWEVKGGKLVNAAGQQFAFEIMYVSPNLEKVLNAFAENLRRAGIAPQVRLMDVPGYVRRMDEHDYDVVFLGIRPGVPPGVPQRSLWSSATADVPGEENFVGAKSPVIDALIEKTIGAKSLSDSITAGRALDRVLLWNYFTIPTYHDDTYRIAYWNRFARPATNPRYGLPFSATWWIDPVLDTNLKR